jgi:hypothetical protein
MWVWVGPKWARPGGQGARFLWFVSLLVAGALVGGAWASIPPRGAGLAFLAVWTVGVVAVEIWNFRTMVLARGRRAEAIQRGLDQRSAG